MLSLKRSGHYKTTIGRRADLLQPNTDKKPGSSKPTCGHNCQHQNTGGATRQNAGQASGKYHTGETYRFLRRLPDAEASTETSNNTGRNDLQTSSRGLGIKLQTTDETSNNTGHQDAYGDEIPVSTVSKKSAAGGFRIFLIDWPSRLDKNAGRIRPIGRCRRR